MDGRHQRIGSAQPWRQLAVCLVMLTTPVIAFRATSMLEQPKITASTSARKMGAMGPNELANLASAHADVSSWDATLSTLYASTVDGFLKPAHGHIQPLFGPPDPFLTSGSSIPPNLKVLDLPPPPTDHLTEAAQVAIKEGYHVVDASKFQAGGGGALPGFQDTGGILPRHDPNVLKLSGALPGQVKEAAIHYRILQSLPFAAFVYVCVDFFLLRADVDLYKEDIDGERMEVAAETMAVAGVRLAVFFSLGVVTVMLFGNV